MAKKRLQKKRAITQKQEPEILKVETSKVEPVKVETSRTEPVKVETSKTEPVKLETSRVEPVKVETAKVEPVKVETAKKEPVKLEAPADMNIYNERFQKHYDELKWLYCELYENRMDMFEDLCKNLNAALKTSDRKREADPDWYKRNDLLGMMMYVNNFAHTLKGLEENLDYVQECNVNYLHLMPLLASPEGRSDGGYAVADFRTVQPELGTMDDFAELPRKRHQHLP